MDETIKQECALNSVYYGNLFDMIKGVESDKELTICPAIKGTNYKEGGIMFVGRSINGWCPIKDIDQKEYKNISKNCRNCGLEWVVENQSCESCESCFAKSQNDKPVPIKHSKFWQFIRFVCSRKLNDTKPWYKQIIWSNLYKVSYANGGNPSKALCDKQKVYCDKILLNEIISYKPKEVYFITETRGKNNWFIKEDFGKVYAYLEKHSEIDAHILYRPEGKKFDDVLMMDKELSVLGNNFSNSF